MLVFIATAFSHPRWWWLSSASAPSSFRQLLRSDEAVAHKACAAHEIPVYILCFNNEFYVRKMVSQLRRLGLVPDCIRIIDNASEDPETREFLDEVNKTGIHILRRINTSNHLVIYSIIDSLPPVFAYTDPDITFNSQMPRTFREDLALIAHKAGTLKAGLALNLTGVYPASDVPYHNGSGIADWEKKFWTEKLDDFPNFEVYKADIDTTFAVYLRNSLAHPKFKGNGEPGDWHYSAVRVAGNFTCTHAPWIKEENDAIPVNVLQRMYKHAKYSTMSGSIISLRNSSDPVIATAAAAD